uniref:Uncharacterized protein n=1 Tax=Anguilla anguilla TaxID=7936 RepID=A0A0E9V4Y8_ANGAN
MKTPEKTCRGGQARSLMRFRRIFNLA